MGRTRLLIISYDILSSYYCKNTVTTELLCRAETDDDTDTKYCIVCVEEELEHYL